MISLILLNIWKLKSWMKLNAAERDRKLNDGIDSCGSQFAITSTGTGTLVRARLLVITLLHFRGKNENIYYPTRDIGYRFSYLKVLDKVCFAHKKRFFF